MDIAEKQKKTAKPEEKPESPPISEIEWKGPEYEYVPKPNNWFWSAGIIAASVAFASALLDNFLFAVNEFYKFIIARFKLIKEAVLNHS